MSDPDVTPTITLRTIALVAVGGAVGSAVRFGVSRVVPDAGGLPVATLLVNIIGSALIGVLVQVLSVRVPVSGTRHHLRLLLGTGVLGGFTTYSGLATGAANLMRQGRAATGITYGLVSVTLGIAAAYAGVLTGEWVGARRFGSPR